MRSRIMYIEYKGDGLAGTAWIGRVTFSRSGKMLYYGTYGCQGCHQIDLKGGFVGPALDKVGSRLKPGWIYHWLKNPQSFKPETIEPNNNLNETEARAMTAFLMSLQ